MLKILKYSAIGVATAAVFLFLGTVAILLNSGDEIKARLVAELNKSTGGNVTISGKTEFSLIKHFPSIALELQQVQITGTTPTFDEPFVEAEKIFLLANIWDVIQSNWKIQSTVIENGAVVMLRRRDGSINYLLEKNTKSNENSTAENFAINIAEARLKNIRYSLLDEIAEVNILLQVKDARVSGNFTANQLSIKTMGNLFSETITIKNIDYANQTQMSFDGSLAVGVEGEEIYMLDLKKLVVENNLFTIKGTIAMEDDDPHFDLVMEAKNISIKDLPMLLPEQISTKFHDISGMGTLQLSAEIKGKLNAKNNPLITANAKVSKAKLKLPKMEKTVENLSFHADFTNGERRTFATSKLSLNNVKALMGKASVAGDLSISNFDRPYLAIDADGNLDISIFNHFLSENQRIKEIQGQVHFSDLKYAGKVSEIKALRLKGIEGALTANNIKIKMDDIFLTIPNGKMVASSSGDIIIENMLMELPGNKFSLLGTISSVPVISKNRKSTNLDLEVKAEKVDVKNLLALFTKKSQTHDITKSAESAEEINIAGSIALSSNFVSYDNFKAYDASAKIDLKKDEINIKDFSCNTMNGVLDLTGHVKWHGKIVAANVKSKGMHLNIKEMFTQMNNFGQQSLTHENIDGKLSFTADIKADFKDGILDERSLLANADISITNGRLQNFKHTEKLSRYIDIDELRDIHFSKLENHIRIENRTVQIPEMLVNSSVMTLSVSGNQTFDNEIDYQVKLNIFDVLGKKFKKRNRDTYEETEEGVFNFYITMKGTLDDPEIKVDKSSIRDRFAQQRDDFKNPPRKTNRIKLTDEELWTNEDEEVENTNVENVQAEEKQKSEPVKERVFFENKRTVENKKEHEELEYIEW